MNSIPVIMFSAWSGTGKTTIIEQLITSLKQAGLRVAAVKHDAHEFEIDREGKDSWRFSHAGADITVIQSQQKTALIEQRSLSLSDTLSMLHDVDIILAEGYNDLPVLSASSNCPDKDSAVPSFADCPDADPAMPAVIGCSAQELAASARHATDNFRFYRIGISRLATGKGLRTPASDCIAIMTDDPALFAYPTLIADPALSVPAGAKVFALDDIAGMTNFLIELL